MGLVRNLVRSKNEKKKNEGIYVSYKNMIFYGATGKSALIGGLSENMDSPILILSPAGGSEKIEQEFSNTISYPVRSIDELNKIYKDTLSDFNTIRALQKVLVENDATRIDSAKKHYGEEWDEIYEMAISGRLPISAIVLEEVSTISNWLQQELEDEMGKTHLGEDKGDLGVDWNKFSRTVMDFYTKFLNLPITTILNTGEIHPKEKQKLTQIIPDLCSGGASRRLTDLVGNVFYCNKTDDGKYFVRLTKNKDIFAKDKLLPVKTTLKLESEIDVTGNPSAFWEYVSEITTDIIKTKNKKESK